MPRMLNDEAQSPKRDSLEDALALVHDIAQRADVAKRLISLHARREDRNARSRDAMARKRNEPDEAA